MKLIQYTLMMSLITWSAHADPVVITPEQLQSKTASGSRSPNTMQKIKQMQMDSKDNLLKNDPQDALQAVMAMNECVERSVGQKGMEQMEKESRAMEKQVKELCKEGKAADAQALQAQYATKFAQSKEYMAMKACAEKYKAMMNDPMFGNVHKNMARAEVKQEGVCPAQAQKPKE